MTTHHADHRRPRIAVVGQFRMLVEAVVHAMPGSARVRTVVLEHSLSAAAARDAVLREKVDAVVLVLASTDTLEALDIVLALAEHGQRVVVTGDHGDRLSRSDFLGAGAAAYRAHGVDQVRRLVSLVLRRRPAARSVPVPALSPDRRVRRNLASLTSAEARILWRLMHGESVRDIARQHVVSVETVRSQIRTVLAKTETTSKLTAVAQAWAVGWRPPTAAFEAA